MSEQTERQRWNMIVDYVDWYCQGQTVTGIELSGRILQHWGVRIDWHEVDYVLDGIRSDETVKFLGNNGPDGHAQYVVTVKGQPR